MCQQANDLVLDASTRQSFAEVQRFQVEKGFDWDNLLQDLQMADLFAPQVIVLTLLQKPDATTTKALPELLAQLPQGYTLIVVGHCRLTKAQLQANGLRR